MKKKALLLMPFFMGYENILRMALEKYYEVDLVNNEKYWPQMNSFLSSSKLKCFFRRYNSTFDNWQKNKAQNMYTEYMISEIDNKENAYSLVICINGHFLSNEFLYYLRNNNINASMILYFWDDVNNLFKLNDLNVFDVIYSFNLDDCRIYNFKYLPMFVQGQRIKHQNNKYDIAIIGTSHSDRIEFVKKIYNKYKGQYTFFIYMYHPNIQGDFFSHNTPLSYNEYLKILATSSVVFDIPSVKQTGPTTRFFDALLTDTKIITTNGYIVQYPVYSKNIYIVDRQEPIIDDDFIQQTYESVEYRPLSAVEWVRLLIERKES